MTQPTSARCAETRCLEKDRQVEGDHTVFVTGATSLLGRLVVRELLARGCRVVALLRTSSPFTETTIAASLEGGGGVPWERLSVLRGDVWEPDLGLGPSIPSMLAEVGTILHLARPRASEEPLLGARAKGVDGVIELARRHGSIRRLVVLSTTDVTGDYKGRFYEDWLDIGQKLSTQLARDTIEAERRARQGASYVPIRVVRHAQLVGHSCTGLFECDAGFSRVFPWGELAARLPSFVHPPAPAEGHRFVTISPVDYVAEGLVEIALSSELGESMTFCLADPASPTLAELFELVLDRVGGPSPGLRFPVEGKGAVGLGVNLVARLGASVTGALGKGSGSWGFLLQRGEHDVSNAQRVLEPAGITCPRLPTYFDALYEDYRRRRGRLQR